MENLKLALIGCGSRGRGHLSVTREFEDVDFVAVCDPVEDVCRKTAEEFGIVRQYSNVEELLDREELDAVVVATPAHLNAGAALPCLEQGIHTILEKPPGLNVEETEELRQAAASSEAKCMVGWNRRFNPYIVEARRLIEERGPVTQIVGEFHKSMRMCVASGNFPPVMLDSLLLETPIHSIDIVRAIAASEVAEVHSFARRSCSEYRDVHSALILFENGCVANLISNYTTDHRLERYEIHGRLISAYLEGVNKGTMVYDGSHHELEYEVNDTRAQNRFFLDCVKENCPVTLPAANLDEAIKTMKVAQAILDSVVD